MCVLTTVVPLKLLLPFTHVKEADRVIQMALPTLPEVDRFLIIQPHPSLDSCN